MADRFSTTHNTANPAIGAAAVVPHDANELAGGACRGLYVGTGGTIVMRGVGDTADTTWRNVPNGALLPFRAQYVRATGTTAQDMLALY